MKKVEKPRPISEAERQWINEQGDYGRRCFAHPGDSVPTNNVFSLDYYRSMTHTVPLLVLEQGDEIIQISLREKRRKHIGLVHANLCLEYRRSDLDNLALQDYYIEYIVTS